jgi:hypothetical protein
MTSLDVKAELHSYLRGARETLVWKLVGLSEYDIRRPLTPTGTNLLGLVKHSTATHFGYFGEVFGRASDSLGRPAGDAGPAAEFWATPDAPRSGSKCGLANSLRCSDRSNFGEPLDCVLVVPADGGFPCGRRLRGNVVRAVVETGGVVG